MARPRSDTDTIGSIFRKPKDNEARTCVERPPLARPQDMSLCTCAYYPENCCLHAGDWWE